MSIRKKLANAKSKLEIPREKMQDHPAKLHDFKDGDFFNVDIEKIIPDPNQPRKFFDPKSLNELTLSIKQKGVLQPVIIRQDEEGNICLVAGERRFRAAKKAGLEKIPAIFTTGKASEIALIENLQRDNLKPVEEAEALAKMGEEYGYTQEQISKVVGKSQPTISETLSLNKLPEEIKKECRHSDIYPRRLLVEVAKQKTSEAMVSLFDQIQKDSLKSGQVRELTKKKKTAEREQRTPASIATEKAVNLARQLEKLDLKATEKSELSQLKTELQTLKKFIEEVVG